MALSVDECHGVKMSFDIRRKTNKTRDMEDGSG